MRALLLPVREDRYALPLEDVSEVVEAPRVTRLPHAPADLLGVMNLRGEVVPVLDPGTLLGVTPVGAPEYAAVARPGRGTVAFALSGRPEAVQLGHSLGQAEDDRARGRFDVDGRLVATLLDLERLVARTEA